jgi:hypothetical protein
MAIMHFCSRALKRCVTPTAPHAAYKKDKFNGQKIYGYVTNSCAVKNFWCSKDTNHIGISKALLDSKGLTSSWNGRKVTWDFTVPPTGCAHILFFHCSRFQALHTASARSTLLAW